MREDQEGLAPFLLTIESTALIWSKDTESSLSLCAAQEFAQRQVGASDAMKQPPRPALQASELLPGGRPRRGHLIVSLV